MIRIAIMMAATLLVAVGLNPSQADEVLTVGVPVCVFLWLAIFQQYRKTCTALNDDMKLMVEARLERIELQEKLDLMEGKPVQTERLLAELKSDVARLKGH
jgi:hypothetical protein